VRTAWRSKDLRERITWKERLEGIFHVGFFAFEFRGELGGVNGDGCIHPIRTCDVPADAQVHIFATEDLSQIETVERFGSAIFEGAVDVPYVVLAVEEDQDVREVVVEVVHIGEMSHCFVALIRWRVILRILVVHHIWNNFVILTTEILRPGVIVE